MAAVAGVAVVVVVGVVVVVVVGVGCLTVVVEAAALRVERVVDEPVSVVVDEVGALLQRLCACRFKPVGRHAHGERRQERKDDRDLDEKP